MIFSVSINHSKVNFQPIEVRSTDELVNYITKYPYSLGTFKHNHRSLDNFISCETIGLDIDNSIEDCAKLSLDDAVEMFKSYKHLILTTKNHQKNKNGVVADRFRVILYLERKIENIEDYYATWDGLKKLYPAIDVQCKDASRFWYPSLQLISRRDDGALVTPLKSITQIRKPEFKPIVDHSTKGKLARTTIDFINNGAPSGDWNGNLFKAAKDIQEQGYSEDEAIDMLTKPSELPGNLGHLDQNDLTTIASAFKREPRYSPRRDYNDPIRNVILASHLIVDEGDQTRTNLVDLTTGERFDISKENIKSILTREEFTEFNRYRVIYAKFTYNPYVKKILFERDRALMGYNMYTPPKWLRRHHYNGEPLSVGGVPPIIDKFLNHLTGNDEPSKLYIYDWLTTALKDRNYTILTAIGDQGIGKGVFGNLLEKLVGESNFKKTRDEVFKKHFNSQLENKRLVYIDELALNTKEAHDRMKDIVNDIIEIEAKGKDAKTITNHASFYISSNHIDAIRLEPDDRRISAIELTEIPLLREFTRTDIEEGILSDDAVAAFASFLWQRNVERDMRIPFRTERFNEMLDAGLRNWQRFVVYDLGREFEGQTISAKVVQERLRMQFPMITPPGLTQLTKLGRSFPQYLRISAIGGVKNDKMIEFFKQPAV